MKNMLKTQKTQKKVEEGASEDLKVINFPLSENSFFYFYT
jgi:hypothetical protein